MYLGTQGRSLVSCPNCAAPTGVDDRFCPRCGAELSRGPALSPTAAGESQYGGFWRRVAAALLDGVVVQLIAGVFGFVVGISIFLLSPEPPTTLVLPRPIALAAGVLIGWLYFALMESSRRQATLGKRVLGLAVTDTEGERLSFARASARHFGKFLSIATLLVGFVMVAFTRRKQGLHDLLARSLVLRGA